ncbi:MAG: DUF6371 domain-containing protein [Paludibacter sp.]|nr:DUF6371 domain-containing protein [Paludibacter sp.]
MDKQYKYSLQKGSSKSSCPECGKKTFVLYVDNVTGKCLPSQFGRCDRESKCGYHNKPAFEKDQAFNSYKVFAPKPKPQPLTPIPFEVLADTLTDYDKNVFIQNLLQRVAFPFDQCDIENVISLYYLGTVATFGGAVALPYIDIKNNIRAIQVKQFDQANHTTKTSFLHSILKYQYSQRGDRLPDWLPAYELNDLKVSCLFGEHLLSKYPLNPVALVEAPKSAIYGTLYFGLPNIAERFIWLAVYNLSSLNVAKCKALQGRDVVLFPDLSTDGKAFDLWNSKLKELDTIKGARFIISDLLEREASEAERLSGYDIADYLICKDWRLFRDSVKSEKSEDENKLIFCPPTSFICPISVKSEKSEDENKLIFCPPQNIIEPISEKSEKSEVENKHYFCPPTISKREYRQQPKQNWSVEISEIEKYFAAVELPSQPVRLSNCSNIIDLPLFIQSHLSTVKANNGVNIFLPHLNRLQTLKQILTV